MWPNRFWRKGGSRRSDWASKVREALLVLSLPLWPSGSAALLCCVAFSVAGKARGPCCLSCWGWVTEWPELENLTVGSRLVSDLWALCRQLRCFLLPSWLASHALCPLVSTQNLLCALSEVTRHLYMTGALDIVFLGCVLSRVWNEKCRVKVAGRHFLSGSTKLSSGSVKCKEILIWNKHHVS